MGGAEPRPYRLGDRRLAKKKTNRRSLILAVLDGMLSMIDWLCESVSGAVVALLTAVFKGVWTLLRWTARMALEGVKLILAVPAWVFR